MKDSTSILERMRELHPSLIDFSLGRIVALLEKMDNPHEKLPPVIHIAGTNGKGSTLAFLRAILEAADLRVHCFVSPHLIHFNERIQLAGKDGCKPIDETRLADVLDSTEKANDGADITFFEITAAAAFLAFSKYPADILILETGLGGRLDATNIVKRPALTVITPVSLDHMHFLGETVEEIAAEKAGIIKQDVSCISAHQQYSVQEVLEEHCLDKDSPLLAAGRDWDSYRQHDRMVFQDNSRVIDLPLPCLNGPHQVNNAGTAIATALALPGITVTDSHIEKGLLTAHWPGRLEQLKTGALREHVNPDSELWLDGGHNPAAGAMLSQFMADLEERVSSPLYLVCGMMERKDAGSFLSCFGGLAHYVVTVPVPGSNPENPHAYRPAKLAELAQDSGMPAIASRSVTSALAQVDSLAEGQPARILICGSLYLAGHVLSLQQQGAE